MTDSLIIANPSSGGGRAKRLWCHLEPYLKEKVGSFDIRWTEKRGDALQYASLSKRYRLVIACGGDGTLHEVANGLMKLPTPRPLLGFLSLGTGGDFIRSLKIPSNPFRQIDLLAQRNETEIDLAEIEFETDHGRETRFFLNIADAGLGADVLGRLKKARNLLGRKLSYLLATIQSYALRQPFDAQIILDGKVEEKKQLILAAVANGRFFGGGMQIAPQANLQDGCFEIILVKDLKVIWLPLSLPFLYTKRLHWLPQVEVRRAKKVELISKKEIFLDIDGELIGKLPASLQIRPRALKVIAP